MCIICEAERVADRAAKTNSINPIQEFLDNLKVYEDAAKRDNSTAKPQSGGAVSAQVNGSDVKGASAASPSFTTAPIGTTVLTAAPKPQLKNAASLEVGEAIRLKSGIVVLRVAPSVYLQMGVAGMTVHSKYTTTIPQMGEKLPQGTALTLTI